MVFILMDKLYDVFSVYFRREGEEKNPMLLQTDPAITAAQQATFYQF